MKVIAAALALVSLMGLVALPCVCVADEVASAHACCATRTSIQAADACCPPKVEPPMAPALAPVACAPSAIQVFLPAERLSALPPAALPRSTACARTPVLRI